MRKVKHIELKNLVQRQNHGEVGGEKDQNLEKEILKVL